MQMEINQSNRDRMPRIIKLVSKTTFCKFRDKEITFRDMIQIALKLPPHIMLKTKEEYIEEGFDPAWFEQSEKWKVYVKLLYGIDDLDKITIEHLKRPLLPHQQNKRCFRSIYNFTTDLYQDSTAKGKEQSKYKTIDP